MHFQSYLSLPRTVSNLTLEPEFSCSVHCFHQHKDNPITYLHAHNYLEIGYCHEGTGIFVVEGKVMPFSSGDVCVIAGSQMHLARSTEGTTSLWTWIYLDPIRMVTLPPRDQHIMDPIFLSEPEFTNIIKPATDPMVGDIVRQIIEEVRQELPEYKTAVRGLVCTFMARLYRLVPAIDSNKPANERRHSLRRITGVLEYLARHYNEAIDIAELAHQCNVSIPTLRRLFHGAIGMAPLEYLIGLRIQMASSLLAGTDLPILKIAFDVGFETLSSFNRHFKTVMGTSPREWRKHHKITS
jgi:AraC-like DNA-binding protein